MKTPLAFATIFFTSQALAQQSTAEFPASASAFLAQEVPQMETAVSVKDRSYFSGGLERMQNFLNSWGLNSPTPVALDTYPACTAAVSDFLIAGLCKISPPGTICEPDTFLPKVAANIAACNELAGLTHYSNGTPNGSPKLKR